MFNKELHAMLVPFINDMVNRGQIKFVMNQSAANKTLAETEYHQAFIVNATSDGYAFGDDDRPERLVKAFFASTASYLSKKKVSKVDEAAALVLTDMSGAFQFGSVVEYHYNKDNPDEPGNWTYIQTFDQDDIEEIEKERTVKKYLYSAEDFKVIFDKVSYDVSGIQFQHSDYMYTCCLLIINTLKQIMDREAKDKEVVEIELKGYFKLAIGIENGIKVFSITPADHMKEIIKNDIALESDID
jgi:hypothetical protein